MAGPGETIPAAAGGSSDRPRVVTVGGSSNTQTGPPRTDNIPANSPPGTTSVQTTTTAPLTIPTPKSLTNVTNRYYGADGKEIGSNTTSTTTNNTRNTLGNAAPGATPVAPPPSPPAQPGDGTSPTAMIVPEAYGSPSDKGLADIGGRINTFFTAIKSFPLFSLANRIGGLPSGGTSTLSVNFGGWGTPTRFCTILQYLLCPRLRTAYLCRCPFHKNHSLKERGRIVWIASWFGTFFDSLVAFLKVIAKWFLDGIVHALSLIFYTVLDGVLTVIRLFLPLSTFHLLALPMPSTGPVSQRKQSISSTPVPFHSVFLLSLAQ